MTTGGTSMRVDYGQDAPGLMRGFLAGGAAAGAVALVLARVLPGPWAALGAAPGGLASVYLPGMGALMVFESRIGKVRDRDAILNRLPWTGTETVLDVGCGRGLMLIGAALRLTTGRAIEIDLWRAEDQGMNSPEAMLANAAALGVADRVSVQTADMLALPFDGDSFDVILSAWAVHNLPDPDLRRAALAEMLRVLRPGGMLALTDIEGRDAYREALGAEGGRGRGPASGQGQDRRCAVLWILRAIHSDGAEERSAASPVGGDALIGNPDALGWRAGLPEDVDGDAAARIPVGPDPQPLRCQQRHQPLADVQRAILVERAVVAEADKVQLQRFGLDQPLAGDIVDDDMGEIGLPRHRAQRGELGRGKAHDRAGAGMAERHPFQHRRFGRGGGFGVLAKLGQGGDIGCGHGAIA
jgi:arsenite methyltransferase